MVSQVIDGDTIRLPWKDGYPKKIRLADIDAPERNQEYGESSKLILQKLVWHKKVKLLCRKKQSYGRPVCYVFKDDLNINRQMVKTGAAWVERNFYDGIEWFILEKKARYNKWGLWGSKTKPREPWLYRKNRRLKKYKHRK